MLDKGFALHNSVLNRAFLSKTNTGVQILQGKLNILGSVTVGTTLATQGAFSVAGTTTLSSTLSVTGAATLSSTLSVTGAASLGGTLTVTGISTFNSNVTVNGTLSATTFNPTVININNKFTMQYNTTEDALDFVYIG